MAQRCLRGALGPSEDQYVGETSLSPECTVKVCGFHQPWKTDRHAGRGGPRFCDGASCQFLHLGEALATKKALAERKAKSRSKAALAKRSSKARAKSSRACFSM